MPSAAVSYSSGMSSTRTLCLPCLVCCCSHCRRSPYTKGCTMPSSCFSALCTEEDDNALLRMEDASWPVAALAHLAADEIAVNSCPHAHAVKATNAAHHTPEDIQYPQAASTQCHISMKKVIDSCLVGSCCGQRMQDSAQTEQSAMMKSLLARC